MRRKLLRLQPDENIVELIKDESLDLYARREVLDGLGHLPVAEVSPQALQALWDASSMTPDVTERSRDERIIDLRPAALASLARLGLLASNPSALRQNLGLQVHGSTWRYDRRQTFPNAPIIVGILYTQEPDTFADAVADLLHAGNWTDVVQLMIYLRSGPHPAPKSVVSALLQRIRNSGPEAGEPDLIILLAELAPVHIASEQWSEIVDWPPQLRAEFAEALAFSMPSDHIDRCVNLLLSLMGDSQYGVRRAAFRSLAKISPERLASVCMAWALLTEDNVPAPERPYAIDIRRRAAEGAAWLETPPTEGPIAELAWDPEPDVRSAFERSQRERREREWAEQYLHWVLEVHDNASLLRAWKYGRALERLGDDQVLERLEDRSREDLPPGVRNWLDRLIDKIRSHWDEVTRGWAEPWFARRGRLERVDAVFEGLLNPTNVSCWLWHLPATELVKLSAWGGWCVEGFFPVDKPTVLSITGREARDILVTYTSWPKGPTYFVGNGPYPEPIIDDESTATSEESR